jgi:hypothetical protein
MKFVSNVLLTTAVIMLGINIIMYIAGYHFFDDIKIENTVGSFWHDFISMHLMTLISVVLLMAYKVTIWLRYRKKRRQLMNAFD